MELFTTAEKKLYDMNGTEIATGVIDDAGKEYLRNSSSGVKYFCDLNGNGKTEILVVGSSQAFVYELDGSIFKKLDSFTTGILSGNYNLTVCDFNGDGLTDILRQGKTNNNDIAIAYSTGKDFYLQTISVSGVTRALMIGDFNRDGKTDIFHYNTSGTYITMTTGICNGNGFTMSSVTSNLLSSSFIYYINPEKNFIQTGDFDGDGRSDFICTYYNNLAFVNTFTDSDQLLATGISDGLGMQTTFSYSTMNDGGICNNQYNSTTFPLAGITTPLYLVSEMQQSALGYSNSTSYFYKRPKWHMQGRGFLGFAEVAATNTAQDRKVTSTYEVDGTYYYPKLAKQEVKTASGSYISKSEFTYTNKTFSPTKCFFPYASTVVETDYLKGNTVTTTMNADSYGNINSRNTNYGDGTLDALSITFSNTATGSTWILGLPVIEIRVSVNGNGSWMRGRNFTYGSNKELTKTIDYIGTTTNKVSETTYTYDTYGNMTSQSVKPYNATTAQTTSYTYSAPYIFPSSMTDPAGIVTNYSYNLFSELLTESSGGRQHTLTYDGMGRVVSETWSGGKSVQLTRSWDNSLTYSLYKVTTASNAEPTTTTWYDAAGRELRTSTMRFDGSDLFQDRTYDSAGRISSVSLPRKNGTAQNDTYTYDSYGRLSSISHAKGGTTSYSYSGNSTTTTDNGISIRRTTNVRGELIESHDACGDITYDLRPDGQPASINAPDNVVTTFSYDNLGRRTAISDPSAGTRTFVYNSDGTLYSQTDADSRTMTMTYDAYLRLSTKTTPQQTYTYTYNSNGLLSSITSTGGSGVELTYDYYQRLSTQKDYAASNKYLLRSFTYTNGNVSQVSYSSDMGNIGTELYTYTNGTLTKVSFAGADVWELDSENSLGQVTAVNSGSLSRGTTYTSNGLLTGITVANGNTTLQNFGYSFSGTTGNLSWRKDMTRNLQESFLYDSMNRLTYCGNGYTTYDAKGNITYQGASYATMQYNDTNKPYAVTGMSSSLTTLPSATQTVTYDALGRPLSIAESNKSATFSYDVDGNRCQMSLYNGSTLLLTRYYSGDRLEEDVTSSGTTARFYVGGDAYTAPAVYVYNGSSWSLHYIGRDHLGSITLVTSSNGTKEYEYSYDAWGRLRNPLNQQVYALGQEPTLFLARGYCGHEHLQDFGLINMNARLYDPLTGRFLSPDPYVQAPDFTQSLNRYSYCLNNPLKYVDKDGKLLSKFLKGITFWLPTATVTDYIHNLYYHGFNVSVYNWRKTENAWKISTSIFKGSFGDIVNKFTWSYDQTVIGYELAQQLNMAGYIHGVTDMDGMIALDARGIMSGYEAMTIGSYSFGPRDYKADWRDDLFVHEYGHYIQGQQLGPLYLPVIGTPSLLSASEISSDQSHTSRWFEADASYKGAHYFDDHYGTGSKYYDPNRRYDYFDIYAFHNNAPFSYKNPRTGSFYGKPGNYQFSSHYNNDDVRAPFVFPHATLFLSFILIPLFSF